MNTVFFSGSRSISRLNEEIRQRIINNIISHDFHVVIGDANGADKAFQKLFAEQHYPHVEIFCSGSQFRNNLGNWQVNFVPSDKKGRDFYAEKDKKMAEIAHYGFVLWDGKSIGSLNNISEMLAKNKFSLVYHVPSKQFVRIKSFDELQALIDYKNPQLIDEMVHKGNVYLKSLILPQVRLI